MAGGVCLGGIMQALIRSLCLAIVLAAAAAAPTANAEAGACVASGNTLEFCDSHYISSLESTGLHLDPGTAIAVGHNMADFLAAHPTKDGFVRLVNTLMKDNAEGKCLPDAPSCPQQQISAEQAVFIVRQSAVFYGPPGLSETVDNAMQSG